jgi:hypothetical protein
MIKKKKSKSKTKSKPTDNVLPVSKPPDPLIQKSYPVRIRTERVRILEEVRYIHATSLEMLGREVNRAIEEYCHLDSGYTLSPMVCSRVSQAADGSWVQRIEFFRERTRDRVW